MTNASLTLHIATDHAGFSMKSEIVAWLKTEGYEVIDHGAHHFDEEDDFPDFISKAAASVSQDPVHNRAIVFGGSGQGEAMVANRFPHVRATVYYGGSEDIIVLSRQHNDANMLSIGARFVSLEETKRAITLWLSNEFDGQEKRQRRNQKIETLTRNSKLCS
jgi:ribose 5-phosphate isomerase B